MFENVITALVIPVVLMSSLLSATRHHRILETTRFVQSHSAHMPRKGVTTVLVI